MSCQLPTYTFIDKLHLTDLENEKEYTTYGLYFMNTINTAPRAHRI